MSFVPLQHPWIVTTSAPVYEIRFPSETSDEMLRAFCEAREAWAKQARYAVSWVVDLSLVRSVTATQRRIFAEHLERFEPHDVAHNRGSAIVLPNALVRGIVTAIFWIRQPKFPHKAFNDAASASAWAKSQLEQGAHAGTTTGL